MKRIVIPSTSPEDWRKILADPEKHWRDGFLLNADRCGEAELWRCILPDGMPLYLGWAHCGDGVTK